MRSLLLAVSALVVVATDTAADIDDGGLSLLQTAAKRNPNLSAINTHRHLANMSSASRYLQGSLDSISIRSIMEDHADMPENDETPIEFQQVHQRSSGSNISGNWQFSTMKYNNLGGKGPDSGTEGIRYADVITINERRVDLIVNALTPYERFRRSTNGLNGRVGKINLYHDGNVDLKFSWIDSETDEPVTMGRFTLSVFDLDEGPDGTAKETLTAGGFASDYMMDFTSLRTADLPDGRRSYASTTHGRGSNNPRDPLDLSEVAAAHSVSLEYPEGLSEFTLNYAVSKAAEKLLRPDYMGRNFLFAGASSLYYCRATPLNIDYGLAKVSYSNLGNQGPDTAGPEGIRYTDIANINGKDIDLIINAVGEGYKVHKSSKNGLNGKYAQINMKRGIQSQFDFTFVGRDDNQPVTIDSVYLSVLDLDEGKRGKLMESVSIDKYAVSYLTEDTEVKVTTEGNGAVRFDSSMPGTGKDNPKDPELLNERQKNRGVTFLFDSVSRFRVTLAIGNGPHSGRNFMFSGKSSVVFC